MRMPLPVLAVLALAACSPEVPDSAAGVGFDSYDSYSARREAALQREMTVRPPADPVQAAPEAPLSAIAPQATAPAAPATTGAPGISDEQSFEAVTARETIESDRERLEAQRQQYVVVEPEPLPARPGKTGPNIVAYALSTTNAVGEQRYRRVTLLGGESRFQRNCARYASSDLAQQAFLDAGGPERDRMGLDPDGDGFACYWDPRPFRQAVNGG
ncbi:hypothetical protein [Rhodovulum adriaticum]|uniref:Excalibur calcium-binding domain-containing protein n=1 Tax=Rhodovulum adriaticum TaxID=35804 RepID=A0A4R2NJC2_RHOAD|nr:hypothetical protein [Rhodovulum adriaticum]MBK1634679.1 hypothetical protein [Rhodovulum adriaticum]TCP21613.1 hypothetical protein EV656_11081 [Rhodovulum adriaticum]